MATKDQSKLDSVFKIESFERVLRVKVTGYSLIKCLDDQESIQVTSFDLAGHRWGIKFYPNQDNNQGTKYISFIGSLLTQTSIPICVENEFYFISEDGQSSAEQKHIEWLNPNRTDFGTLTLLTVSDFEESEYLQNDTFTLECDLRVGKPVNVNEREKQVAVPSSDFFHHFGQLLETRDGADVTFTINDETIVAHKTVLVARSPVFKAQFFGSMLESNSKIVKIDGVTPKVFKFMLHFIYTDMLPHEAEISLEMGQHLLVAADQYGLERLKLISGEILCRNLNVESSATTLVLAEQHNCKELKEVCVDFISSRAVLDDVMASDGFKHLIESCPFLLKELLEKVHHSRRF